MTSKILLLYLRSRITVAAALALPFLPIISGMAQRPATVGGFNKTHNSLLPSAAVFIIQEFGQAALAEEGSIFNVDADEVAATVTTYFQQVDSAIADGDIRLATQKLSFIDFKIKKHNDIIPKNEKKAYVSRLDAQHLAIQRIIDSLVQANLTIVKKNGRAAGIEFRRELAGRGISEAQLAMVDDAILNAPSIEEKTPEELKGELTPESVRTESPAHQEISAPPQKREPPPEKTETQEAPVDQTHAPELPAALLPQEFPRPSETPPPSPPVDETSLIPWPDSDTETTELLMPADVDRQKGKALAETSVSKIISLLDQGKIDEAMTVFQVYRHNMQKFLPSNVFEQLKSSVETASTQDQKRRAEATRISETIDDLVDRDRCTEALELLRRHRGLLQQCLEKEEFTRLEEKVERASAAFGEAQAKALAKAREVGMLLRENANEAMMAFERSREELKRYLPKDSFEELRKQVERIESGIRDTIKRSQLCRRDILALIEDGEGIAAYARFMEKKSLLKAYLDQNDFSSLADIVTVAQKQCLQRQARAQASLQKIDSLIAARRIKQARDLFSQCKDTLRSDLADEKRFFELKNRVRKAYDKFVKNRKKASRSVKRINSFVRRKEGRDAHTTFLQDAGLLKEFLEVKAYTKLKAAVQTSLAEYEANVAAARKTAARIEALLKRKRFEQALTTFKAARDTFDHYLENDAAIMALEKRTDSSYTAYRKHKKLAAEKADDIQWYVDQKKGNQALALFKKERQELTLYLEPTELSSLASAVMTANRQYLTAKRLAEKNVIRLNRLLYRKRFDEAYLLFKELHPSLEPYLPATTYTNLDNKITDAYEEHKKKKKRAENYADELKDLVKKKKLKEARRGFRSNQKILKQYLDKQSYADLTKAVWGSKKKPIAKVKSGRIR